MKVSIICPFYNEELITESCTWYDLKFRKSNIDWELVCVNDEVNWIIVYQN